MIANLLLVFAAAYPLDVADFDVAFDAVVVREPILALNGNEGVYAIDGIVLWCPTDIAAAAKGLTMPGQHVVLVRDISTARLRSVALQGAQPALAEDLEKFARKDEVEAQAIRIRRVAAPTGSGFYVTDVCASDRYGRVGLRTGDVVVGVNGSPADFDPTAVAKGLDPAEAKKTSTGLRDPRPGTIDVIRDGMPLTLKIDPTERGVAGGLRSAAGTISSREKAAFVKRQ